MKKTPGIVGMALLSVFTLASYAQQTPTPPQTPVQPQAQAQPQTQTWEAQKNPTVDSIAAKYRDKIVAAPAALSQDRIFPVIGHYESTTNTDAASVSIMLDQQNKGLIWIEGLPQGKLKGLLTKSPATYKIPAQKTEDGKEVAEGTLIYDKEMNTLSICIGKIYNAENPAAAFMEVPAEEAPATATAKTKTKVKKPAAPKPWMYTGTKSDKGMAGN